MRKQISISLILIINFHPIICKENATKKSDELNWSSAAIVQPVTGLFPAQANETELESYTIKVNLTEQCHSQMFGWFIPNKNKTSPIIVYLNGGPGGSSLDMYFLTFGQFRLHIDLKLRERNHSWTERFSMLFIDNPVGSGFSVTDNRTECYVHNQDEVARDLFVFLKQFFISFPDQKVNDLYIVGGSYGAKYACAIGHKIVTNLEESSNYFNFKGISLASGYLDPISQIEFSEQLFHRGLINEKQLAVFQQKEEEIRQILKNETRWPQFREAYNELVFNSNSLFVNFTKLLTSSLFNYARSFSRTSAGNYVSNFLSLKSTRRSLNVGDRIYDGDSTQVSENMIIDIANSTLPMLEKILDSGYKVLIFNGQFDLVAAVPFAVKLIKRLNWKFADEYQNASRIAFKGDPASVDVDVYLQSARNFHFAIVRKTGHSVSHDQPLAGLDLITRFIEDRLPTNQI